MPLVVCVCMNRYERVREGERERGGKGTHIHTATDTHRDTLLLSLYGEPEGER